MATLRLPSGEMRLVRAECRATVGTIGNADHQNVKIGKAGRKRHMGVRPQTRGTAMNPVDHPHGGGEGSTTPGRHPVTPWGVPTLGYRTRKKNKAVRPLHRARPPPWEGQAVDESRSSKKGPWVEERLMARIEAMNASNQKTMVKTWSRDLDDLPGDGRSHDRRPRRPQARARLRLRVDGRSQARRVRADAHLPRSRRHRQEEEVMAQEKDTQPDAQAETGRAGRRQEAGCQEAGCQEAGGCRRPRPLPRRPASPSSEDEVSQAVMKPVGVEGYDYTYVIMPMRI